MSGKQFDISLSLFQSNRALRCKDVVSELEKLGFEVRDGKRGGHKVFFHGGLSDFRSGSFNCDHGKNPQIKPAYISKVAKTLKMYEQELKEFLK
jgi:hypothetical protein